MRRTMFHSNRHVGNPGAAWFPTWLVESTRGEAEEMGEQVLARLEGEPSLLGMNFHLLAIGRVPPR